MIIYNYINLFSKLETILKLKNIFYIYLVLYEDNNLNKINIAYKKFNKIKNHKLEKFGIKSDNISVDFQLKNNVIVVYFTDIKKIKKIIKNNHIIVDKYSDNSIYINMNKYGDILMNNLIYLLI